MFIYLFIINFLLYFHIAKGSQNCIVILTMVRCNDFKQLGFTKDLRRFTVAITRAKSLLIVVACTKTMKNDETLNSFIKHIESHGTIYYPEM